MRLSVVVLVAFLSIGNVIICAASSGMPEGTPVDPNELPDGMDKDKVPPGLQKWSFKAPKLSEEEAESMFFPDSLKCDGCKAVTYKLYTKFASLYFKYQSTKGRVKESEILDGFESVCAEKNDEYAVKDVKGVLRMVGPGLEVGKDEPGIIQGGGKMPTRVKELCHTIRGELGEEEVYEQFLKDPEDIVSFEKYLCHNPEQVLTSSCLEKKDKKRDEL